MISISIPKDKSCKVLKVKEKRSIMEWKITAYTYLMQILLEENKVGMFYTKFVFFFAGNASITMT